MPPLKRKQRSYNGNPLAYYEENIEAYEGMGRAALSIFDPGLYKALERTGQLEEAIPNANQSHVEIGRKLGRGELDLSNDELEIIIEAHSVYKGHVSEASRHLPYTVSTIWKKWKSRGLVVRTHNLDDLEISIILKAYEEYNGNACQASKHLLHSASTIIKHWRNNGLEIRGVGRPKN